MEVTVKPLLRFVILQVKQRITVFDEFVVFILSKLCIALVIIEVHGLKTAYIWILCLIPDYMAKVILN